MGPRGICASHHQHASQRAALPLDRRTLLKATAGLTAMLTTSRVTSPRVAAQAATTRAGEWAQPDAVGGESEFLAFEADFAFNAIAAHWPGDTPFPASD